MGIGLVAALFAACAHGSTLDSIDPGEGGGGSASQGKGSAGAGTGMIGSPCTSNDDCAAGTCTPVGGKSYCTLPCPPACPDGTYCSIIQGKSICVPDLDQQCQKCNIALDCKLPSDECLVAPLGDSFCAIDCTTLGTCPNGFTCMDRPTYEGTADPAGSGDAGTPPPPEEGVPSKWCVPNSGASCPCDPKRDKVTRNCVTTNACGGTEACNGETGSWGMCVEAPPGPEVCNKRDDDCNGQTDEGDPNMLCSAVGSKPPHSSWTCQAGQCRLGKCDAGWAAFPPDAPEKGCSCQLEAQEPNGTCGVAKNAGSVSDTPGSSITLQGTLSSANDVDVWTFSTVDTSETTTNSYHVSIDFTSPSPNDEFVMDVIRGSGCTDTPSGPGVGVTSYDWCVDGQATGVGEGPCGNIAGGQHCADHSSPYYVRVSRKSGATATCTPYVIIVTGQGGRPCDFAHQCQ